jgi:hypothetical protein
MSSTNPLTTVLTQLTAIDTASAAIQSVAGTYPSGTAGLSTVEGYLATINSASASLRALITAATPVSPVTPTPIPVTPVPPVPPTPVPVTGSSTPILSDTFTSYTTTAALQAAISTTAGGTGTGTIMYQNGWLAPLASIDSSVLYSGHQTLKLSMPGGEKNCPALWANLPSAQDIIWFRTKIRFSPGFTTTGTATGGNAFKLLAWGHDIYDGSGRLEIANTTQYQLYWNIQAKNTGTLIGGGTYAIDGNITTEWTDGGWYDYIIKVDRSKGTSAQIAVWMAKDGSTPVSRASTTEAMLNGSTLPHIVSVGWSIEFNQVRAANQTQAIWIGQWEVVSGTTFPNPYGL